MVFVFRRQFYPALPPQATLPRRLPPWCNYNASFGHAAPVGSFNGTDGKNDAKRYYGYYDMSGNVEEWTSSTEQTPGYSRIFRVVRGGYWVDSETGCRVTARRSFNLSPFYDHLGFRLAQDP
jgi:formylglycine-generating enzyme required for sulfatase activity